MTSKTNPLDELNSFLYDLEAYGGFRYKQEKHDHVNQKEITDASEYRNTILEKIGPISEYVTKLGGTNSCNVIRDGKTYQTNLWQEAVKIRMDRYTIPAIEAGVDTIKQIIGQLKYDIEHGTRNDDGDILKPILSANLPAKAFISHGKPSMALDKIELFLRDLGIEPLIVKDMASEDKTVDDKVNHYLDQADCVVILATGDDLIDEELHPRENVIHETGLAQATHKGKIIYFLEEKTEFPSNIRPKVWETFKQDNMENVFQRIVIELKAFGILQTMKPEK